MSPASPTVSVITTVYNGEEYIDRCIKSILSQTLSNFEYIIVDDGSEDNSLSELRDWEKDHDQVRVIASERVGRARALNIAVNEARGPYIANQDIDDISFSDRLYHQVAHLESNPSIGLLGGASVHIDQVRGKKYKRLLPETHGEIVMEMAKYIPLVHTFCMYRSTAIRKVGGYCLVDDIIDFATWIKIIDHGWKANNLPTVLGKHYKDPDSYFNKFNSRIRRQTRLSMYQVKAIHKFGLPAWMYIFPLARPVYNILPPDIKGWVVELVSSIDRKRPSR